MVGSATFRMVLPTLMTSRLIDSTISACQRRGYGGVVDMLRLLAGSVVVGSAAVDAGLVAVPEGLLHLRAGGAELVGLAAQVVEGDVELVLVEVLLERV